MTAPRRKRLLSIGTLGTLLTLLVLTADWAGYLVPLEGFLYDVRARRFQYFAPPPTDKLIHVDVDDSALAQVGAWPWERSRVGELVEEMSLAGAKVVVLDVLFDRPSNRGEGEDAVDHDAAFAESLGRAANVLLVNTLDFPLPSARDRLTDLIADELRDDLGLQGEQVAARLASRGHASPDLGARVAARLFEARGAAMRRRIAEQLDSAGAGDVTPAALRAKLLPAASARSTLARQLNEQYARVMATRGVRRFAATAGPDTPPLLVSDGGLLPLAAFSDAARGCAFVTYLREEDGLVRSIPLVAWYEGAVLPQVSLAAACAMMDVDVRRIRVAPDAIFIPRADAPEVRIPIHPYPRRHFAGLNGFFDIPLFGKHGAGTWATSYDFPKYEKPALRTSVIEVWKAVEAKRNIETNEVVALQALAPVLEVINLPRLKELAAGPRLTGPPLDREVKDAAEQYAFSLETLQALADPTADERTQLEGRRAVAAEWAALEQYGKQTPVLRTELARQRAALARQLAGRAVFFGSIATGAYDFVPTSLDPQCPGVYLHSAAFNAIMTGEFWRIGPPWATVVATAVVGLLTTFAVAFFSPSKALAAVLVLAGGYTGVNGLLFDRHNLIVGAAGPLVAAGVVWSGITLLQFIREVSERARLTRRFSSYVDPTLVNYVIENPEQVRLEAHEKELTVCFTDLAGFTTLSEKLRAQSAKLLGQYMETMVPLIRARRGYVNKFLGDGIMFFFGSPIDNPDHAADAVGALLDMQRALAPFNERLAAQGLPTLAMRSGLSTGLMVVGDAGPSFASDYTVLGDAVNLAARLEGANKAFGTSNLITARTVELLGGRYVVRPIADLLVVGKQQSVFVHEALAPAETATEGQKQLAALTAEMVSCFAAGKFEDCVRAAAEIERVFGATRLTARYIEESESRRGQPPDPEFRGQIQLITK